MFSNFKNAFIRRPQFTIKTPDAVLDMISKGLPAGMRYVHDHDGLCRLECDGEFNVVPNKINLPEDARTVFEKKATVTIEDVMAYAYNSQKRIELLPDDEGYYIVNGEKIKKSDFVAAPLKEIEFTEGNIYIVPPPFPDPFPLELSGNGHSLTIMIQRQPMNSIDEIKFSSVEDSLMSISYTLNLTNDTVQFNISTNESNNAKDVLRSKEIFNAAVLGNGMINESPIPYIKENQNNIIAEETLAFWHKVVEVEDALSVTFNMAQEITIDDIKLIDALHRSFVEKKPFKTYLTDLKLSGIGDFNEANERAKQTPIGKEIMFEFTEEVSVELFDVKLKLFSIACIFDCMVSEIKLPQNEESGEFYIKLIPAIGKRMFSSKQYYLTKDMVEKIRLDKHVEEYHNADELKVY